YWVRYFVPNCVKILSPCSGSTVPQPQLATVVLFTTPLAVAYSPYHLRLTPGREYQCRYCACWVTGPNGGHDRLPTSWGHRAADLAPRNAQRTLAHLPGVLSIHREVSSKCPNQPR